MTKARLQITFLDFWTSGTGRSSDGDGDTTCYRDADGCPAMPMTQIKGILRATAEEMGLLEQKRINQLFGTRAAKGIRSTEAQIAFVADAQLAPDERAWFKAHPSAGLKLFAVKRATAIDAKRGVANPMTLRKIEVAVPMTLTGTLLWQGPATDAEWVSDLNTVCTMTLAFGAFVHDGYGSAIASVTLDTESSGGEHGG